MSRLADKLKPGVFVRTAHKGASALAPENTLIAFRKAVEIGVDLIELDVRSTSDGKIVVLHDPTVDRTTDGTGPVKSMRYEDLRKLDAAAHFGAPEYPFRDRNIRIPLLEEVLDSFPQMDFTIEVKSMAHPNFIGALTQVIRSAARDRIIVASEDHRPLSLIRKALPGVCTSLSRREIRRFFFMSKLGLRSWFRSPGSLLQIPLVSDFENNRGLRLVTAPFIRAAHKTGRPVHVWTINDPDEMRRLIRLGVDGITTDRPDLLNLIWKEQLDGKLDSHVRVL